MFLDELHAALGAVAQRVFAAMLALSVVALQKLDFVVMRVTAMRYVNDGLEFVRFRNVIGGFEVFTSCAKGENL